MSKAKQYSDDYLARLFHKSMYTNWKICPWSMHTTFSTGQEIHASLAMQFGTINHEFHEMLLGTWAEEEEMFKCVDYMSTLHYLEQFIPPQAPFILRNGMKNIVAMEAMRWANLMNVADNPWFWWKPYAVEASNYQLKINEKGREEYSMVGTVDVINRHYPHEDKFEVWELKAKINPTRVRYDLSFYTRMIEKELDVVWWVAFGYNDSSMLNEAKNPASLRAFDKAWPVFLNDVDKAMNGITLVKKPLASAFGSGFIPPICTYCNYQEGCYGDWRKEY